MKVSYLDKPISEIFDNIECRVLELRDLEQRVIAQKEIIADATYRMRDLDSANERLKIARYVYWMLPEVRANDVAFGLQGTKRNSDFMKAIGSVSVGIECDRCNEVLPITSRTQMAKEIKASQAARVHYPEGFNNVCNACWEKMKKARHAQYQKNRIEQAALTTRLQSMPYGEYLQTPEWKKARKEHLALLMRAKGMGATHSCELCENENGLTLKHKSKASVGREFFDDLILLCLGCVPILEENGRVLST